MERPEHLKYTFTTYDGSSVTVMRGSAAPKMVGGNPTWNVVNRPRRTGLTQWQGHEPYQMDVPVLFDAYATFESNVESAIARLQQMQQGSPPPTITVEGAVPIKGIRWVITGIDWGDEVIWSGTSQRAYARERQDAIVHLMQYIKEERLAVQNVKPQPRRHTYKKGETLRQIALKWYKDASKWKLIRDANNIRDPQNIPDKKSLKIP